tara:strand:- start:422 stop:865 length:444 start_codon:yes stop_codon:yes gene_type:complete
MIDAFSLATAALAFGSKFFADDRPPTNTKGQMGRKQTSSSFLDFDFLQRGAKAFVGSRRKKNVITSPPRPRPRTISQLTRGNKFSGVSMQPSRLIGSTNPDLQVAMRRLVNATNKDVIQLIPMNVVSPNVSQKTTLDIDTPKLGKIT